MRSSYKNYNAKCNAHLDFIFRGMQVFCVVLQKKCCNYCYRHCVTILGPGLPGLVVVVVVVVVVVQHGVGTWYQKWFFSSKIA